MICLKLILGGVDVQKDDVEDEVSSGPTFENSAVRLSHVSKTERVEQLLAEKRLSCL